MLKLPFMSFVFICLALFSLAACGNNTGNPSSGTTTGTVSGTTTAGNGADSSTGTTPTLPSTSVPFKVAGVDLVVNPDSIAGKTCGTAIVVTYTATFHIAANSPGGTIQFTYTVNNGRSSPSASVSVAAGQTTATYAFTWSGNLPADHIYPGLGGVITSSPNAIQSPMVQPTGMCS